MDNEPAPSADLAPRAADSLPDSPAGSPAPAPLPPSTDAAEAAPVAPPESDIHPAEAEVPRPRVVIHATSGAPPELTDRRITFENGAVLRPELAYWVPQGFRPLTLDLYLPPEQQTPPEHGYPVLIFLHGGGWLGGSARSNSPISDFPALLAAISAEGYVVASVNYRLSGEAKWPAQAQDVKAAIRYLRASAKVSGLNPDRIAVWGVSAGAQLAAVAATSCGLVELQPESQILPNLPAPEALPAPDLPPQAGLETDLPSEGRPALAGPRVDNSDCVQAAVGWFGVYDFDTLTDQARLAGARSREEPNAPEWRLLGCMAEGCSPHRISSASAVQLLTKDAPPVLLITGDSDRMVPAAQSMEFAGALANEAIPHELHILPGVGHGFMGADPLETSRATQKALDLTLDFLATALAPNR